MRSCPACGTSESEPMGNKDSYHIFTCKSCSSLFVSPEPSPSELEDYYREYSYGGEQKTPVFIYEQLQRMVSHFAAFRRSGNLLDVGCGAGELLLVSQDEGWNAFGLETSGAAVTFARSRGLSVEEGDFLSYPLPSDFDVVVMSELIEHLPDPVSFLRRAFEVLRPGGLLHLTTPNGRSLSRWIMGLDWSVISPPEHIQLFNVSSLSRALHRCGYDGIRVKSSGLNAYELRDYLFRSHRHGEKEATRNENAFKLNEQLTRSPVRRGLKSVLNAPLRVSHSGDSLKAWAKKP